MNQTRRRFLQMAGIGAGSMLAAPLLLSAQTPQPDSPNIIIIFTDDQGYQDVGCFGSPLINTPNLDRMASEGMRFTDFYSAAPICSPSRAALLTGCYPPRVGITGVLFPEDNYGLNPDETTIAELLKERGYVTACIGKWHLGEPPTFLPTNHGFDYFYGLPFSNDEDRPRYSAQFPRLMRNDTVIEAPTDRALLTKRCTEETIKFVTENQSRPFFVYLSHPMPHVKLDAAPEFKGKSARGLYGDVIEEIDWSTGRIIKTLKSLGLDKNTLIVFTSDNGPWELNNDHGGCALPLRGYKFQTYEGGMREPTIMRWPGKIPAGAVCSEIAATIDMLPTIAHLTGGKVPDDRAIDGKNIWPLMAGSNGAKSPHKAYFYYRGTYLEAIRSGKWKLRRANKNTELYDLQADIGEKVNLAEQHPEIVKNLTAIMNDFDRDLKSNAREGGKVLLP